MAKLPRVFKRRGITIKDCAAFIREFRGVGGIIPKTIIKDGPFRNLSVEHVQNLTRHIVVPILVLVLLASGARAEDKISDATKMALPTAEEMATFEKAAKKAALAHAADKGEMGDVLNRLKADPEKWNDADFKARLDAEAKMCALWAHKPYVEHVPKAWSTYAAQATKMDDFLKRVLDGQAEFARVGKNVPAFVQDGWIADAIDQWMEKAKDTIKTDADKKKFLFWLREKKVSAGALNTLMKTLK